MNQPYLFGAAIYAGMIAGGIYLLFQMFSQLLGGKKWLLILSDVLFVLILFAIMALSMFWATGLAIRPYYFFGLALGFAAMLLGIWPVASKIKSMARGGLDQVKKKRYNKKANCQRKS